MDEDRKPEPEALHLGEELLLMDDGSVLPCVGWLDEDGEECDRFQATVGIAGTDEAGYYVFPVNMFEAETVH
jgi:hypothetical protein